MPAAPAPSARGGRKLRILTALLALVAVGLAVALAFTLAADDPAPSSPDTSTGRGTIQLACAQLALIPDEGFSMDDRVMFDRLTVASVLATLATDQDKSTSRLAKRIQDVRLAVVRTYSASSPETAALLRTAKRSCGVS